MRREFVQATGRSGGRATSGSCCSTGDLGFAALEPFAERLPEPLLQRRGRRAEHGRDGHRPGRGRFTPFVYSISTFASMRAYEFIRNGAGTARAPRADRRYRRGSRLRPQRHDPLRARGRGVDARTARARGDRPGRLRPGRRGAASRARAPGPGVHQAEQADRSRSPRWETSSRWGARSNSPKATTSRWWLWVEWRRSARRVRRASGPPAGCRWAWLSSRVSAQRPSEDLVRALSAVPLALSVEAHYITGGLGSLLAEVIAERGLACRAAARRG